MITVEFIVLSLIFAYFIYSMVAYFLRFFEREKIRKKVILGKENFDKVSKKYFNRTKECMINFLPIFAYWGILLKINEYLSLAAERIFVIIFIVVISAIRIYKIIRNITYFDVDDLLFEKFNLKKTNEFHDKKDSFDLITKIYSIKNKNIEIPFYYTTINTYYFSHALDYICAGFKMKLEKDLSKEEINEIISEIKKEHPDFKIEIEVEDGILNVSSMYRDGGCLHSKFAVNVIVVSYIVNEKIVNKIL